MGRYTWFLVTCNELIQQQRGLDSKKHKPGQQTVSKELQPVLQPVYFSCMHWTKKPFWLCGSSIEIVNNLSNYPSD
jgi:hypothetical protein